MRRACVLSANLRASTKALGSILPDRLGDQTAHINFETWLSRRFSIHPESIAPFTTARAPSIPDFLHGKDRQVIGDVRIAAVVRQQTSRACYEIVRVIEAELPLP
jgi:hypothetical protein